MSSSHITTGSFAGELRKEFSVQLKSFCSLSQICSQIVTASFLTCAFCLTLATNMYVKYCIDTLLLQNKTLYIQVTHSVFHTCKLKCYYSTCLHFLKAIPSALWNIMNICQQPTALHHHYSVTLSSSDSGVEQRVTCTDDVYIILKSNMFNHFNTLYCVLKTSC